MNTPAPGLFVLRDRRQSGEIRELQRFTDPVEARIARDLLLAAGDRDAILEIVPADELERALMEGAS